MGLNKIPSSHENSDLLKDHHNAGSQLANVLQQDNDYDNDAFVNDFHELNQEDANNLNTTHVLENIILNNFSESEEIYRAELGGGTHIGSNHYTQLFQKAKHVDRVDLSQSMLHKANEVLSQDPEKTAKVSLIKHSFIDYLSSKEDNSIDAVNMKYCINYLSPVELPEFMKLVAQKLKKGGIFSANYGMMKEVLPVNLPTAKFLHNGKEISEPIHLKDSDTYTILFINEEGRTINKGTTKNFYSKNYFKEIIDNIPGLESYIGSSNDYLTGDQRTGITVGVIVLKKKS